MSRPGGRRVLALLWLLLVCAVPGTAVRAQEGDKAGTAADPPAPPAAPAVPTPAAPPVSPLARDARRDIDAVLAGEEFNATESQTVMVPRKLDAKVPEPPPRWPLQLGRWLSKLGTVLLWLLAGVLVLTVVALRARWLPWLLGVRQRRRPVAARPQAPVVEHAPPRLPEDPIAVARLAWQAGDAPRALSLLYQAALACLATRHGLRIPEGATEGDALRLLTAVATPYHAEFRRLTQAWIALAYAGRRPADFDALLEGCGRIFAALP